MLVEMVEISTMKDKLNTNVMNRNKLIGMKGDLVNKGTELK